MVTSDLGNHMAYPDDNVEALRKLLHQYDLGVLTSGEVWGGVYTLVLRECINHLKKGRETFVFGSGTDGGIKESVKAMIEFGPTMITVKPLVAPPTPLKKQ